MGVFFMPIVRSVKTKDYTTISNSAANDQRLSLKAKGLFYFLMSKPDTWEISYRGLVSQLKEGQSAVLAALQELEDSGYLERSSQREGGKFTSAPSILHEQPCVENSRVEKLSVENPTQVNTNRVKTEQVKTDNTLAKAKAPKRREDIDRMFAYWAQSTGIRVQSRLQANRFACANLLKRYSEEELRRLVDGVAAAQQDRFAPRIPDFSALQANLGDLLTWGKQRSATVSNKVVSI